VGTRRALALASPIVGLLAFGACFPDITFGGGGADAGPDGTVEGGADARVDVDAGSEGSVSFDAGSMTRIAEGGFVMAGQDASLTHAFLVDTFEVSVGRFRPWVVAGKVVPCDGGACDLDVPGGPYAGKMKWDPSWNSFVGDPAFQGQGCSTARDTTVDEPTYPTGVDEYPVSCVNYFQAVAFCAFEGKRLLTETEWQYVAQAGTERRTYAWGNDAPSGCNKAIWFNGDFDAGNGCGWPKRLGSAPAGASASGVQDLTGSLYEWVWDETTTYPGGVDYIRVSASTSVARGTRGGSFGARENYLHNDNRDETTPGSTYADIGLRCARTLK
jgi:sulfatase modifying factor 1